MIDSLRKIFARNLDMLSNEIQAYANEETLWVKDGAVNNTGGTLCLHLCGNLQHFIGSVLGDSGYVRNRDAEFSHQTTRTHLLEEIEKTKAAVDLALQKLAPEKLLEDYPIDVLKQPMTVEFFLIHLQGHLNYHLGQISYHRRLLDR